MNSMFGAAPPQGMFGQQQGGPLMQLLASNPQLMQMLLAGGLSDVQGQRGMPQPAMPPMAPPPVGGFMPSIEGEGLSRDPYAQTLPEQYNAGPGRVPGTMDNMFQGMGIPPGILQMLLATPRSI